MRNGSVARQENAEKNRTINDPRSPRCPSTRTSVYARPANSPPATPIRDGINTSAPEKPGLTTRIAPQNAAATAEPCTRFSFSLRIKYENRIAKNGDSLFKIEASDSIR